MARCNIPEPYELYDSYCAEQEKITAKLPVCIKCHLPIDGDYAYNDGDGYMCEDCWDKHVREEYQYDVDNLIDEGEVWETW